MTQFLDAVQIDESEWSLGMCGVCNVQLKGTKMCHASFRLDLDTNTHHFVSNKMMNYDNLVC